jgi:hypothetical protein
MATVWKLVVLITVLLMPFGMAPATAAASHPQMTMDMAKGHCPDQGSHHDMKGGIAECTMACAGALPAADLANHEPLLMVGATLQQTVARQLRGLHPDTATPPPKRS